MKTFLLLSLSILTNILYSQELGKIFNHKATSSNIFENYTRINNSLINGNPNAQILITHAFNPDGLSLEEGVYNDHVSGIWYDGAYWNIFNEDLSPMIENSNYTVFIGDPSLFYKHEVTAENRVDGNSTRLPDSYDDNLNTYFYNNIWEGIYNNHQYLWDYYDDRWYLYTPDLVNIPFGTKFIIHTPHQYEQTFAHYTGNGNVDGNFTEIPIFFLDNSPHAKFIVNVDYSFLSGTPQLHKNIGVMYRDNRWGIYTEDQSPMPTGVRFNILFTYENLVIQEEKIENYFQIYPNPVQSILKISKNVFVDEIKIISIDGKTMGNYKDVDAIDVSGFMSGVYIIQFRSSDRIISRRFIKK